MESHHAWKATIEKAMALKLDSLNFHVSLFGIALYQGDAEGARKQEEWAKGKPEEGLILNVQATQAGFSGQYRKYRELTMRAVEIAQGFNPGAAERSSSVARLERCLRF
jgi:hypothetical protein